MPLRPTPEFSIGDRVTVHNQGTEIFTISAVNPAGPPMPHQSHAYYYKDDLGEEFRGVNRGYYEGVFEHAEIDDD